MAEKIRDTDDDARALARSLIDGARFGAIGVRDPQTGAPFVSRVALATTEAGDPLSLISDLSHHTQALVADPVCSLLVGEPGPKGDPLTHPRLSLFARADIVRHGDPRHPALAEAYLTQQPKAKLYIGFGDFSLVTFEITGAHMNGGFGKAYILTPDDLRRR